MNLCCDIGNTRIKLAVFDSSNNMVYYDVIDHDMEIELDRVYKRYTIDRVITSSTRGEKSTIEHRLIERSKDLVKMDHSLKMPFENSYDTAHTLGKDRMAVVAAAAVRYPEQNTLIVDAGTCVTYDFVDEKGVYHGGNIAPGLNTRLKAMHSFTTSLPKVEPVANKEIIGKSTKEALQNGAFHGLVFEINGYTQYLSTVFGQINVILTGGDAEFFGDVMKSKIFVHPYLVLEGLNEILKLNE